MARKAKSKYRYPLYEVKWFDAEGDPSWSDPKAPLEPTPCVSIGFLIKQNDDYVKLAACYIDREDDDVSSTDKIPRKMITSMKELKIKYVEEKVQGRTKTGGSVEGSHTIDGVEKV